MVDILIYNLILNTIASMDGVLICILIQWCLRCSDINSDIKNNGSYAWCSGIYSDIKHNGIYVWCSDLYSDIKHIGVCGWCSDICSNFKSMVSRFRDYFNYALTCAPRRIKMNLRKLTFRYSRRGSFSEHQSELIIMRNPIN